MDSFFLTYYSVSSLIGMFMGFTLALYLLTARDGSAAMRHIGITILCAGMLNVAYFISSTFYDPLAAYHRWITVPFGLAMAIHPVHLYLQYPTNRWPRISRVLLIVQYLGLILSAGLFFTASIGAPLLYHFDGHYWDFIIEEPTKIVGLVILVNSLGQLVAGIAKAIVCKGRERWTIIGMLAVLFFCGMAQGATNSLSREGVIGRDAFQTTFSLTIVLGMFAIIIIFLNNTRDRTTFLAKLIGISLVTILLVMQALSFFVLGERTRAYDELRVQEAKAVRNHEAGAGTVAPLFLRDSDGTVQFFPAGQEFRESVLPDYPLAGKENLPRQSKSDLQHGRFQKATRDGQSLNYISYRIHDANVDYEVAFPYLSYRSYVHSGASTLAILLVMVMIVLVAGFPLFFRGALINPLMELLGAVKRVDEGDLQANVRVRVEDEIGQLGHYFNGMVVSIRDAQSKLKEYADRLEEKVQERTAELQKTLTRVQELKNQQDGDYFLTSLLLRPLQANRAKSETVNVDFLIRQKKSFTFRKWEDEIGGDLCMAESIKLRGRPFTLFLNADAMGKSMQGAGGALVLGAVLEAIVDRTMLSGDASSHHPERWLKNAFIELHKVFETFDGSMLISMVFGLVDDNTGLVYMINAEHPWSVMYKGGKADFVETDLDFRKLGTLGVEGSIFVKTLQLEAGDVLIAGSDGRDDVRVQRENGDLFIQDDENEFLQHVEAGRGELKAIVESIERRGQLTDDLSLLRIGYREDLTHGADSGGRDFRQLNEQARAAFKAGDFQKAINLLEDGNIADSREAPLVRLLAQCYLRIKDYSRAVTVAEDYCFLRPADTEMLYAVSYAAGRSGQLDKAADYGERIRLREPHNTRYLLNLARIYAGKGNRERAQGFLDRVLESEPDNEVALKLAAQLKDSAPN